MKAKSRRERDEVDPRPERDEMGPGIAAVSRDRGCCRRRCLIPCGNEFSHAEKTGQTWGRRRRRR